MIHKLVFSQRGVLLGVLASLVAVGFAIPATAAAEATSLTSCQPITMAGTYRLDANVTGAGSCFIITTSGVTLILNGHTIGGTGFFGIDVGAANAKILGPGTLTGWTFGGIFLAGGNGSVRGVTATNNGDGILITSAGNDVRGNVASGNDFGILAGHGAGGNTIIGNFAHENGVDLADGNANCDNNVWTGNDFTTSFPSSCIN